METIKFVLYLLISVAGICATIAVTTITGLLGAVLGALAFAAGIVVMVAWGIKSCFTKTPPPTSTPDA